MLLQFQPTPLYSRSWAQQGTGRKLTGFNLASILTTTPNALLADVHDRKPVNLPVEHYDLWLAPSVKTNLVKNDDPECAEELKQA
jgi:putative SOS response-associated peptidase YedK